jgi:hypothetical protein
MPDEKEKDVTLGEASAGATPAEDKGAQTARLPAKAGVDSGEDNGGIASGGGGGIPSGGGGVGS